MSGHVLAIDAGNELSAYALLDAELRPVLFNKVDNSTFRFDLTSLIVTYWPTVAIEQIGHYGTGMPAGKEVFDTCRWIGRFEETIHRVGRDPVLVKRATVKTHLCGSAKAKDGNVRQALIDRFGPKGTKKEPGWFYGVSADVWQAIALGVYVADTAVAEHQGPT